MISKEEYKRIAAKYNVSTHIVKNLIKSFIIGGGLSVLGELLFALYRGIADVETARSFVSLTLIILFPSASCVIRSYAQSATFLFPTSAYSAII